MTYILYMEKQLLNRPHDTRKLYLCENFNQFFFFSLFDVKRESHWNYYDFAHNILVVLVFKLVLPDNTGT